MDNEIFVIVTRMSGASENEFENYFPDGFWAALWKTAELILIPTNDTTLEYDKHVKLVFADGMKINQELNNCESLKKFLTTASNANNCKIFMLVHKGVNINTFDDAIQRIFKCNDEEQTSMPSNLKVREYSSTNSEFFAKIKKLVNQLSSGDNGINEILNEIKKYILVSMPHPHLVALSILCQGYLTTHGGSVEGWDNIPGEIRNGVLSKANDTEKKTWWTSILGIEKFKMQSELDSILNSEKVKIQPLIDEIYNKNDDIFQNGAIVLDAYKALKSILKG